MLHLSECILYLAVISKTIIPVLHYDAETYVTP